MYLHKNMTQKHAILTLDTFMYDEACIQNLIGLGDSFQSYLPFTDLPSQEGISTVYIRGFYDRFLKICDIPIGIPRGY
jgi:hypothetical protein